MILTDVLTASDLNPRYYEFIPIFIKTWKKLFPEINIHIILISNEIIEELESYKEYIKLFPPIEGIKTSFIAQNIRLLYPCLLENAKGGILITDMDMIPMNTEYYTIPIKHILDNKFISYRPLNCVGQNEMAICYNIAHNKIWQEIFNIKKIDDIEIILKMLSENNNYKGHKHMPFWITDQLYLYQSTQAWNKKTNNLIILNDAIRLSRLDRLALRDIGFRLPPIDIERIKDHKYADFHLPHPYSLHKELIDKVINYL